MKTKLFYCMLLLFSIGITACSDGEDGMDGTDGIDGIDGEDGIDGINGEQGPQGEQGPIGPQGIDGNANVTQYTFGENDFSVNSPVLLNITGITQEEMMQNSWFAYLVRPSGNVYPIPGLGLNGTTEYRLYWAHLAVDNGTVRFTVSIQNGPGEVYSDIIVVRVLANNTEDLSSKEPKLPNIDFRDYQAVKSYYGLK